MLPRWRRRVLAYRLIGAVPAGERALDWVRMSGGGVRPSGLGEQEYRLREMLMLLRGAQVTVEGRDLVEVGAGWNPVLPALFHGLGARSIVMTDVRRHMRRGLVEASVAYCLEHARAIAALVEVDETSLMARLSALRPGRHRWEDVWASCGIAYAAPVDFRQSGLPSESADILYSHSCLNYIPIAVLPGIARESARILRPGGLALHDISVYDDLSSIDPSIPGWNFLTFGSEEWEQIGNSGIHHQNRLRPRSYSALLAENGMRIVWEHRFLGAGVEPDIDRSILHAQFRDLPAEEILCQHYLLAAAKLDDPAFDGLPAAERPQPTTQPAG